MLHCIILAVLTNKDPDSILVVNITAYISDTYIDLCETSKIEMKEHRTVKIGQPFQILMK